MNAETKLRRLFSQAEIDAALRRLASEITRDYGDKNPLVLGILKGSFIFMADLIRRLDFPLEVEFIRLSSYGSGRQTSGRVKMVQGLRAKIRGRHVLVVEDIIDTGVTLSFLLRVLERRKPRTLRVAALLDKPARRARPVKVSYVGFEIPDAFVVGYGLDHAEDYRNLRDVYIFEQEERK